MQDPNYIQPNDDIVFSQTRREFRNIFESSNIWEQNQDDFAQNDYFPNNQLEEDFSHNFLHDDNMSFKPLQSDLSQMQSFYP